MPDITASVEFIAADHPRYDKEKPYWALLREGQSFGPGIPSNNMEFESHDVVIRDMRGHEADFQLDDCGFQVVQNEPSTLKLEDVESCERYQRETEEFLRIHFGAEDVSCYGLRVGKINQAETHKVLTAVSLSGVMPSKCPVTSLSTRTLFLWRKEPLVVLTVVSKLQLRAREDWH
jgi:hypothetical protein